MPSEETVIPMTDNLRAVVRRADDNPKAVIIFFQAREHEEAASFRVTTSAPIVSSMWRMPGLKGGQWLSLTESEGANHYAISVDRKFLDKPFIVGLEIESEGNPVHQVAETQIWSETNGRAQVVYIEFKDEA